MSCQTVNAAGSSFSACEAYSLRWRDCELIKLGDQ